MRQERELKLTRQILVLPPLISQAKDRPENHTQLLAYSLELQTHVAAIVSKNIRLIRAGL